MRCREGVRVVHTTCVCVFCARAEFLVGSYPRLSKSQDGGCRGQSERKRAPQKIPLVVKSAVVGYISFIKYGKSVIRNGNVFLSVSFRPFLLLMLRYVVRGEIIRKVR